MKPELESYVGKQVFIYRESNGSGIIEPISYDGLLEKRSGKYFVGNNQIEEGDKIFFLDRGRQEFLFTY
jgi:hypothetical protein